MAPRVQAGFGGTAGQASKKHVAPCQHAVKVSGSGKLWLLVFDSVQAVKVLAVRQGLHDSEHQFSIMERMHGSIQKTMSLHAGVRNAQGRLMLSRVTESAQRMSGHLRELSATKIMPVCHSEMHHAVLVRHKADRLAHGTLWWMSWLVLVTQMAGLYYFQLSIAALIRAVEQNSQEMQALSSRIDAWTRCMSGRIDSVSARAD